MIGHRPVMELPLAWLTGRNRARDDIAMPRPGKRAGRRRGPMPMAMLAYIAEHPGCTAAEAGRAVTGGRTSTTHFVRHLESLGYITRGDWTRHGASAGRALVATPLGLAHIAMPPSQEGISS